MKKCTFCEAIFKKPKISVLFVSIGSFLKQIICPTCGSVLESKLHPLYGSDQNTNG